jgi:flavin-dependent dehydrogenase
MRVLLVDQQTFPRDKVCGGCLSPRALALLRSAGLASKVDDLGGIHVHGLCLGSSGIQARLPLGEGMALSRRTLDAALVEAALGRGVDFLTATRAKLGSLSHAARSIHLTHDGHQQRILARVVLAADGLAGRLGNTRDVAREGSWIGAGTISDGPGFYQPQTIFMACGRGGYVGLVRIENGQLDIAAALDPNVVKKYGGPSRTAAAILREAGFPELPPAALQGWRGTPPLTRQARRIAQERLFVLGDAAGYVEPFTGEGMAWALASAQAVVPLAVRAIGHWIPSLEDDWLRRHREIVQKRQKLCSMLVRGLRHRSLTWGTIQALKWLPGLARPILAGLGQDTARSGINRYL